MLNQWFVVETKSGKEKFVETNVATMGFTVFLPYIYYEKKNKKTKLLETHKKPLFPSYLFVQQNPYKGLRHVNTSQGVIGIVGSSDGFVTPLPEGYVENLMQSQEINHGIPITPASEYVIGAKIRLKAYPSVTGTIISIKNEKITAHVTLLLRKIVVILPSEAVCLAS